MTLSEEFAQAVEMDLRTELTPAARRAAGDALVQLFQGLRKKPVDGLPGRIVAYETRIRSLVANLEVKLSSGRFVVKARGSDERTLNELRFGSDWFEGTENITETILAGALIR